MDDGPSMNLAAATCDCGVPMIDSAWLAFFAVVVVVAPALAATAVRHRRGQPKPAADDLLAGTVRSNGRSQGED